MSQDEFRESGVGLMSVSPNRFTISIKAKRHKSDHLDVQYFVVDRFLKELLELNIALAL